ncbi:MAG: CPBP family intramembrane metalloprotease [Deltaproteobacteria bacterium]|nr:MAG: CPBP family intramembrane metalloprotease [Deltaproteobacteria bacterium]
MDDPVTGQRTDRVLFVWILLAGLVGSLLGLPWTFAILRDSSTVWLSAAVEVLFFLTPASAVGVWLGKKVGLGSRLRDFVSGMPGGWERVRSGLLPAMLVGVTFGGIGYFAQNSIPEGALMPDLSIPNTFEWFLRCISAALTEEIFFRFGLMTFFVWVIRSIVKKPAIDVPSLWIGNLLSALVFAGAHLPQLTSHGLSLLIPFVMFSTGAGMVMGWLYMRYGLVAAIVAHFIGDLMVYVIPRLMAVIV